MQQQYVQHAKTTRPYTFLLLLHCENPKTVTQSREIASNSSARLSPLDVSRSPRFTRPCQDRTTLLLNSLELSFKVRVFKVLLLELASKLFGKVSCSGGSQSSLLVIVPFAAGRRIQNPKTIHSSSSQRKEQRRSFSSPPFQRSRSGEAARGGDVPLPLLLPSYLPSPSPLSLLAIATPLTKTTRQQLQLLYSSNPQSHCEEVAATRHHSSCPTLLVQQLPPLSSLAKKLTTPAITNISGQRQ
ncbi:hypothetical protein H5410_004315 [Solanum commersonii]|uniref:Uncharacterized protein n=1 Tax=Solanum commersonii TaxID=4109 RepID=A0A9J6B7C6_SOLCO|nr:hypothetical protein H5410_004315 [Solanum commersonii]